MRQSRHFGITVKDAPKDARTAAHRLLLRAGYLRTVSPGVHVTLPFFRRVTDRLERAARDGLEARGFEEVALPLLATGPLAGGCAWRAQDARGATVGIGPDGMAAVRAVAARDIRSYKDLPRRAFQLGRRPGSEFAGRGSWLDGREFLALDAFAFDCDETAAAESLGAMRGSCEVLLGLAGLSGRSFEADVGPGTRHGCTLGVPAAGGDVEALACDACSYAADPSVADSRLERLPQETAMRPMEAVHGPGLVGVGPLAEFLGIPVGQTTKTLLFQADGQVVAVMVRGDCDVNEAKLRRRLGCRELALAAPAVIREVTGAEVGYAGGVGLPASVRVVADHYTRDRVNFECGANRTDYHSINVNWGRDLPLPEFGDVKSARPGERCARCAAGRLTPMPAVAVGRLVTGTGADGGPVYQDPGGTPQPATITGCTFNLTRLAVLAAETHHDDAGLKWPAGIAPFGVHLIGLNLEDEAVRAQAESLYASLRAAGVAVLFDDRDARAGEKFSDSDLFGIPVRLTVSKRMVREGKVELKRRGAAESEPVTVAEGIRAGTAAALPPEPR